MLNLIKWFFVSRYTPKFLLDPKKLIVLGNTVTAAGRTGLDLPGVYRNGKISDKGVLRLSRPMGYHRLIPIWLTLTRIAFAT